MSVDVPDRMLVEAQEAVRVRDRKLSRAQKITGELREKLSAYDTSVSAVELAVRTAAEYMGLDGSAAAILGSCAASMVDGRRLTVDTVAALYGRTSRWVWKEISRYSLDVIPQGGGLGSLVDIEAFVSAVGLPVATGKRRGRPPRSAAAAGLAPRSPIADVASAASSTDQPRPDRDGGGTPLGTTPTPPTAGADGAIAQSARSIN